MKKNWLLPILGLALILIVSVLLGCAGNTPSETGVLEGKASIGPRSPEEIGQPYLPEVYQIRKVAVYDADHVTLIKQVDFDKEGYYRVELPEGTYTIDINYVESDYSNAAPRKLTIEPGLHYNFDIDFNTGASLNVIPSPGGILLNSENQSTEIVLNFVHIDKVFSDRQYFSPWYPLHTVNVGEYILEVSGGIQNNHPYAEIATYAEGYDEKGKQVAWTLDAAHISGQIGLHLEKGKQGEFTLHLNYAEDIKSIRIFAVNNVTPP